MKSVLLLLLFLWVIVNSVAQTDNNRLQTDEERTATAEEPADKGKLSARIYTHFNWSLNRLDPSTTFEVNRAYFGYSRQIDEHFSGEVKLDIGSPDDVSEYSLIRRYTYFKNAYISYSNGKFISWFGLFDMLQFKVQEKFWDYRYIYKSYICLLYTSPSPRD